MVELRVIVSDETAEHLAERARAEHTTPEQLASKAVRSFVEPTAAAAHERPGFIGLGRSGRSDISDQETTAGDRDAHTLSTSEVSERASEILGYDVLEADLMAEGYAELGAEMLSISETTLGAQTEALPPE